MHASSINLVLYYLGFGYVLFLVWGTVLSDAVKSEPPGWTVAATTTLMVIGIVHPAAALAAWDLRRELKRGPGDAAGAARPPLGVVLSIAVAVAVVVATGMGET